MKATPALAEPRLLRFTLRLDATACGLLGLLALASAPALQGALGVAAHLLRSLGVLLLVATAAIGSVTWRPRLNRRAALAIIALNVAWVGASLLAVILSWSVLTSLGIAVILAQAVATTLLAGLEFEALRRSRA